MTPRPQNADGPPPPAADGPPAEAAEALLGRRVRGKAVLDVG